MARAATIRLINGDGPGEGLNDTTPVTPVGGNTGTTLGEQRLIVIQRVIDNWAARIDSPVEIRVSVTFDALPCDAGEATLGMAGPVSVFHDFAGAPAPNTLYPSALADRLAGMDLAPEESDIEAQFNSSFGTTCSFAAGWYYGLDGATSGDDSDLYTVALHELGHGMGFISFVDVETGAEMNGLDDAFLQFLVDDRTGKTFPAMSDAERRSAIVATGHLKWNGDHVVAASGRLTTGADANGRVEMYAPPQPEVGSSVSHWSDVLVPAELMQPFFTQPIHTIGLAAEALADMGWNAPQSLCPGDCGGVGQVAISDLITAVNILLGSAELSSCPAADADGSGTVTVSDLVKAVLSALNGCSSPTPSPIPTATPTEGPTPTPPPKGCPFSFQDDSESEGVTCLYMGRWNPNCGDDTLEVSFKSNGTHLVAIVAATDPVTGAPLPVGLAANVTSPTTADLTGWFTDFENLSDFVPLSGAENLAPDGTTLSIDPDSAPFGLDNCDFVDYRGTFTGTAGTGAARKLSAAGLQSQLRHRLGR